MCYFVQMRTHYVSPRKEPEAIRHIKKKKKRLLEELESFVFLHCHTNMRSKTYHSVQNKG